MYSLCISWSTANWDDLSHLQIKQLEDWFKAAEAICYSTGQGSMMPDGTQEDLDRGLFEFDPPNSDLGMIKSLKKRGGRKMFGDDSLQCKMF